MNKDNISKRKVLVIDDDRNFRSILTEELVDDGFDVIGAGNGIEALCELSFSVRGNLGFRIQPDSEGNNIHGLHPLENNEKV